MIIKHRAWSIKQSVKSFALCAMLSAKVAFNAC